MSMARRFNEQRRRQQLSPQDHCDRVSSRYRDLWKQWGISDDRFVRTTNPRHLKLVEQFYERVKASGDIVVGKQTGWYCVDCEEYKDDPAEAESPTCPIHRKPLEWRDEENLFFRLSRYQSAIEELVARDDFIAPTSRRQEVRNFVAQGLRDFSISRVNVSWGLPVPDHPGHTFYVWFDALLGYLTALLDDGEPVSLDRLASCGWPASVHVIGKDILRFHAVFWPAMCMSAGLPVPQRSLAMAFSPGRVRRWANPSAMCWTRNSCWSGAAPMPFVGISCATSNSEMTGIFNNNAS